MNNSIKRYLSPVRNMHFSEWIFILLFLYFLSIVVLNIFSYSIDIGGIEFAFLNYIQLLDKNGHLYLNPDAYPFFDIIYPPLHSYTLKYLLSILQINPQENIHEALIVGRLISFILGIINGYILIRIIKLLISENKNKILLLLIGILLLPQHFFTFRPDSFKVSFFILFLYFTISYEFKSRKYKHLIIGTVCSSIGVFFKHDLAIYIIIYYLISYLILRQRSYLIALMLFILVLVIIFLAGYYSTNGLILNNIFLYNLQYSSSPGFSLFFIGINSLKMLPFLIICYYNIRSSDKATKLLSIIGFIFFIVSELTLLRAGSNLNYTYESIILMLINTGIFLKDRKSIKSRYYRLILVFYLPIFCFHFQNPTVFNKSIIKSEKIDYQKNIKTSKVLSAIIKQDTVFFSNPKYIIFNNQLNKVYGYDLHFDRYAELYLQIPVDLKTYNNNSIKAYDNYFKAGRVKYIVIEDDSIAKKQIGKFYTDYTFFKKTENLLLYKFNTTNTPI